MTRDPEKIREYKKLVAELAARIVSGNKVCDTEEAVRWAVEILDQVDVEVNKQLAETGYEAGVR